MEIQPECLVCGQQLHLSPAQVNLGLVRAPVYCTDCGTPHHRDCFEYGGQCAVFGCGCLRYSTQGVRGRDVISFGVGGERVQAVAKPVTPRIVMDLETPLESVWNWLALGFLVAGLLTAVVIAATEQSFHFWLALRLMVGAFAFTLVFLAVRVSTDCYYVLDTASRKVLYHRRFLGSTQLTTVTSFDRAKAILLVRRRRWTAGNKFHRGHYYSEWLLELVVAGRKIPVSDAVVRDDMPDELEARGQAAADLLGCRLQRDRRPYRYWEDRGLLRGLVTGFSAPTYRDEGD